MRHLHGLILFLLSTLMLALSGCDRAGPAKATAASAPAAQASVVPAAAGGAADDQPAPDAAQGLARFRQDIAMCQGFARVMAKDTAFTTAFEDFVARSQQPLAHFLNASPHAGTAEVRHILAHPGHVTVDVNMHGEPFAAAAIEGTGIYCAVNFVRVQEVEALGESAAAWQIRQHFLEAALKHLVQPSSEMTDGLVEFEVLESMVQQAAALYTATERPRLQAWLARAIDVVSAQKAGIEAGAGGQTAAEQEKFVDQHVAALRGYLKAE